MSATETRNLMELGENLQSLEGVADGARNLEHGKDLGELQHNEQAPPLARSTTKLQNIVEILFIIENETEIPRKSVTKMRSLANSARTRRALKKSETKVGNLRILAQSCRVPRVSATETENLWNSAKTCRALRVSLTGRGTREPKRPWERH